MWWAQAALYASFFAVINEFEDNKWYWSTGILVLKSHEKSREICLCYLSGNYICFHCLFWLFNTTHCLWLQLRHWTVCHHRPRSHPQYWHVSARPILTFSVSLGWWTFGAVLLTISHVYSPTKMFLHGLDRQEAFTLCFSWFTYQSHSTKVEMSTCREAWPDVACGPVSGLPRARPSFGSPHFWTFSQQ